MSIPRSMRNCIRFVIFVEIHQLMQNASGLMGAPVRVDIGPVTEKKVGDLEVVVEDRPGERGVENLLHTGLAPFRFPRVYAVGRRMIRQVAQCRLALRVEPAFHACEVSIPGCVRQIVGQAPDTQQRRKQTGLRIREREFNGLRWRRLATAQHSGIEIKKSSNESFAIAQYRPLDQSDLEFHACVCQHPWLAAQSADKGCQVAVVQRAHDLSHGKSLPGPAGSALVKASVSLSAMMYWTNADRPGPPSICLPSSTSSVMDRSSSSPAAVACRKRQAHRKAWFTAPRS